MSQEDPSVVGMPEWLPDSAVSACLTCGVEFSLTLRRHHCRSCGRIICADCSRQRRALLQSDDKVRVCDDCVEVLDKAAEEAREAAERGATAVSSSTTPAAPASDSSTSSSSSSPTAPTAAAASTSVKPTPVQALPPRLVPPTAAPVAAAPRASGGGLFSGLASRLTSTVEAHAPGLVAAVKEQMAVAAAKQEAERAEKKALTDRMIAAANATENAPTASPVIASPASATSAAAASGDNVAHIPGLGAVALAAPSGSSSSSDAHAWDHLQDPVLAGSEMRQRGKAISSKDPTSVALTTVSGGGDAAAAASFKMDLPLRLCLVILKKTSGEMREKYSEYLTTKARRHEGDEPLSFSQFMFFSTIRTLPEFLFKKTELAYCMMRDEGETLVFAEHFRRYAPILSPLASKIDADYVFAALEQASIASGAALSRDQLIEEAEAEAAAEEDLGERPLVPTRRRIGGVGFVQFKTYVDTLRKYARGDGVELNWSEFRTMATSSLPGAPPAMDKHEQLLLVRSGVTDTTSFPPHIGRLGLTTNHLIYESSIFNRRRCIRWSAILRVERNEEGSFWRKHGAAAAAAAVGATNTAIASSSSSSSGTASTPTSSSSDPPPTKGFRIVVLEDDGDGSNGSSSSSSGPSSRREVSLTFDIPGWGTDTVLERLRTFEYIRVMIHLHKLVATIPDKVVASALIQETCTTLKRMRALEAVGHGCNPLLLNPFAEGRTIRTGPATRVEDEAAAAAATATSVAPTIGSATSDSDPHSAPPAAAAALLSSIQASISRADTIRKSKSSWLFAVLPGLQNKERESLEEDIDPELAAGQYATADELLALKKAHEQPFSLKNFAYNVKLFRHEIEPVMLFIALLKRVRDWENPIVTLATVMMLLNMSYRDYLMYLPAMLILFNIVIIAVLRYYPDAVWIALGGPQARAAEAAASSSSSSGRSGAHIEEVDGEDESKEEEDAQASASSSSSSSSSNTKPVSKGMPVAAPVASPVGSGSSSSSGGNGGGAPKKEKKEEEGLLQKLKSYRDVAVKTKDYLHSVQNNIADQNTQFMKVEGLYKWRSPVVTQKFFVILCAGFLIMTFIPFRFIFPLIVLDFFTTKWQRQSTMERLLEEVPLPARMPDID